MQFDIIVPDMTKYSSLTQEEKEKIYTTPYTIAGGDIPSIMGINPYKGSSNVDLYYKKIEKKRTPVNDAMMRGHDFEAAAKLLFKWTYQGIYKQGGANIMVRSKERPYIVGVPDDIVMSEKDMEYEKLEIIIPAKTKFIHEIKSKFLTRKLAGYQSLEDMANFYLNMIDQFYEVQMQLYLYITGLKYALYTIIVVTAPPYSDFRKTEIKTLLVLRNDELIQNILRNCDDFYQHLLDKKPPAIFINKEGI